MEKGKKSNKDENFETYDAGLIMIRFYINESQIQSS